MRSETPRLRICTSFDIGKLDITLGYKINKSWGIEAGYMPAIYGRILAAGTTYTIAISFSNN